MNVNGAKWISGTGAGFTALVLFLIKTGQLRLTINEDQIALDLFKCCHVSIDTQKFIELTSTLMSQTTPAIETTK